MHSRKFIFLGRIFTKRNEQKREIQFKTVSVHFVFMFTSKRARFSKETFISSLLFSNLSKLKSHMSNRVAQIRFRWGSLLLRKLFFFIAIGSFGSTTFQCFPQPRLTCAANREARSGSLTNICHLIKKREIAFYDMRSVWKMKTVSCYCLSKVCQTSWKIIVIDPVMHKVDLIEHHHF